MDPVLQVPDATARRSNTPVSRNNPRERRIPARKQFKTESWLQRAPATPWRGQDPPRATQAACGTSAESSSGRAGSPSMPAAAVSMPSVARQSSLRTRAASCGGSSLARTTPSIMSATTAGHERPRLRTDTSAEPSAPRRIVRSTPATRGGVRNDGTCNPNDVAATVRRRPASANLRTWLSLMPPV